MFSTLGYLICIPFAWLVRLFYNMTGSYGVAIILFTLVVKLIMLPFQIKSKKSMMRMNRLSGKMQEIQKKYANNQMKQQEEVAKGKVYEDNPILAVIQPASVPMQPSNSRKKILLVYTFLGFMAASAWVLRKELLSLIPLSGRQ